MTQPSVTSQEDQKERGFVAALLKADADELSPDIWPIRSIQPLFGSTGQEDAYVSVLSKSMVIVKRPNLASSSTSFQPAKEGGESTLVWVTCNERGQTYGLGRVIEVASKPRERARDRKEALRELIGRMAECGFSFSYRPDEAEPLNEEAALVAKRFLELLPPDRELPKIAPDGDGGLMMAWEGDPRETVVIGVFGKFLYAVVAPGTQESLHVAEERFDHDTIPSTILDVVPGRSKQV